MSASDEDENILRLWDFWSGQMIGTFQGHTARVMAVEIMPNGHRAVSASLDGTLRLWDLESGQMIRTFQGHSAEVWAMAITPDGHRTVSASRDKTVRCGTWKTTKRSPFSPEKAPWRLALFLQMGRRSWS
jgi:WD40 repeat protein